MKITIALLIAAAAGFAQPSYSPPNDLPNPYKTIPNWAQLPDGQMVGRLSCPLGISCEIET